MVGVVGLFVGMVCNGWHGMYGQTVGVIHPKKSTVCSDALNDLSNDKLPANFLQTCPKMLLLVSSEAFYVNVKIKPETHCIFNVYYRQENNRI